MVQLEQEYIVGEVESNWLDRGSEVEDERLKTLMDRGKDKLKWVLRERGICRGKQAEETLLFLEI